MSKRKDILTDRSDLKEMPFTVPEGYFAEMSSKVLASTTARAVEMGTGSGRKPFYYYAAAAVTAVLLAVGTVGGLLSENGDTQHMLSESDYVFFCTDLIPATAPETVYYSYYDGSDDITDEDIVNYLIESGADVSLYLNE